jgi:protein-disulfide isomerase-like protein with CxxC motif
VLEVLQDVSSWSDINWTAWEDLTGYDLMRTVPSSQMQNDFGWGFEGYPTFPLIDLETMEVVDSDCWYASSWQACINAHL